MRRIVLAAALICLSAIQPIWAGEHLFRDEEFRFRFSYPDSWAEDHNDIESVRISVTSNGGRGVASCNVVASRIPELEKLSRTEIDSKGRGFFTPSFTTYLIEESFGSEVVRTSEGELDGRPAGFVLANDSLAGSGSRIDVTIAYAITIGRLGVYTVSCGSVRQYFNDLRPEFTRIIRSFHIDEDF